MMKKTAVRFLILAMVLTTVLAAPASASDYFIARPACGKNGCVTHYLWVRPNYNVDHGWGYRHAVSEYCTDSTGDQITGTYDTYNAYCSYGDWVNDDNATCTSNATRHKTCHGCGYVMSETIWNTKLPHTEATDEAVDSTCTETGLTEGKHCSECSNVLVKQDVIPATGHTEATDEAVAPTCTEPGLTDGKHCSTCGAVLESQQTIHATGHSYRMWMPAGEHAHKASCANKGCTHIGETSCTLYELTANEEKLFVCPVCGEWSMGVFEAIEGTSCEAVEKNAILRGERIVRALAVPFGEKIVSLEGLSESVAPLYAFTVAYEYAGCVEKFGGAVSFSVPLELEEPFTLVRLNAAEDAEELWSEIPYEWKDGILFFETDCAGLYLIIPAN